VAWSLDQAGSPTSLPLQPALAVAAALIQVPIFIGADQPVTGDRRWEPGRYVFEVEAPAAGYERWFGVEISSPPGKLSD
jgi:hypothetical protein